MVRIRRFGVVPTANSIAAMYAVVFGVVLLLVGLVGLLFLTSGRGGGAPALGLLVALIVGWLLYTAAAWVAVALSCLLYNGIAGRVGGIQIQIENAPPPSGYGPGPGWGPIQPSASGSFQPPAPWEQARPGRERSVRPTADTRLDR